MALCCKPKILLLKEKSLSFYWPFTPLPLQGSPTLHQTTKEKLIVETVLFTINNFLEWKK
jgi:hypothetical protein